MNYRHIYHAGNFADVFKHIILLMMLEKLKQKDKPFCVIDTHAGIGKYDLHSQNAERTGEYKNGIGKLIDEKAKNIWIKKYIELVRKTNGSEFRFYPGSPVVAQKLIRNNDRIILSELHNEDFVTLKKLLKADNRIAVHHKDAYESLKAFLPPKEKRGLVLIDPPFEKKDEFETLISQVSKATKKWATGIFAIWYPIKDRALVQKFHDALIEAKIPEIMVAEFMIRADKDPLTFNGSGMVIINPPWKLYEEIEELLPELSQLIKLETGGKTVLKWLTCSQ